MKLAEALILRADLQTRLSELRGRLVANARVQEGELPAEDPSALLQELDQLSDQLEDLITRINLTNARTLMDGVTLTAKLAQRECLKNRISILHSFLDEASNTVVRATRSEVRILSTVPVSQIRKDTDHLSEHLRTLETAIQGANWITDLQ